MKTKSTLLLLLLFVVLLYGCPNRNFNKPNGTPMIEQVNEEVVYICIVKYKSKGREESRQIELTKSSNFRPEPFFIYEYPLLPQCCGRHNHRKCRGNFELYH